ncbi:hypothetical protein C8J56DRAFT_1169757 [Mycena floridula]|nr:hypothetical protein C8J56DRAFT_1169757 [Mycena floridula]
MKTLVLCFDGTRNTLQENSTNVVKFFELLKKSTPQEQMVYYQPGIGTYTSVGPFSSYGAHPGGATLDFLTGCYLSAHVCGGYQFLMEVYSPGDKICLFGFSRGAYTARVLAAMLHKVGLLPRQNFELVQFAWSLYKRTDEAGRQLSIDFRRTFSCNVEIHFIGVWDTVSSIGLIPQFLPYTASNPSVHFVRHALALDERRIKHRANHWTNRSSPHTDVKEVWFAGAHGDVGGGNKATDAGASLSYISLRWMVRQCQESDSGVVFDENALRRGRVLFLTEEDRVSREREDARSPIHEKMSWKAPWWYLLEIIPMKRHLPLPNGEYHETIRPNLCRGRDKRENAQGMKVMVHASVRLRTDYHPKARFSTADMEVEEGDHYIEA